MQTTQTNCETINISREKLLLLVANENLRQELRNAGAKLIETGIARI